MVARRDARKGVTAVARMVSTVDARGQLADIINRSAFGKERIVLTRRGKQLVAVVPIEDLQRLDELDDRLELEELERRLADPTEKPIPYQRVRKELGLR